MENHHFLMGKSTIKMGHLYHGELLVITKVSITQPQHHQPWTGRKLKEILEFFCWKITSQPAKDNIFCGMPNRMSESIPDRMPAGMSG